MIATQRCPTRSTVRARNLTVASSQPATGGRRSSPPAAGRRPGRPAARTGAPASSLRNISANTTIAATRPAMPSRAATTRPPVAPPWRATRARASTGMPSLMKLFHTPETSTAVVVRDRE